MEAEELHTQTCIVLMSQVSGHSRSGSLDGNLCVYENEATVLACLQQSHPPRRRPAGDNQQQHLLSAASGKNCAANLGLSASLYNSLNTLLSQAHGKPPADGPTCPRPLSGRVSTQQHVTHSGKCADAPPPTPFCIQCAAR